MTYRYNGSASAIDEYARHLTRALCEAGAPAAYVDGGLPAVLASATRPRWIFLQYNPNSYGRRGWAPGLVRDAIRVRRRWPDVRLMLNVHEAWVEMADVKTAVMGSYQRVQLRALLRIADGAFVTRVTLLDAPGIDWAHLPVASNIVPPAATRQDARAQLGIGEQIVVTIFGTGHPARLLGQAEGAIRAICDRVGAGGVSVINLGRDAPAISVPDGVQSSQPGSIEPEQVALRLRASDLLLLPLSDGVSTRRTTLMAGLAHGVPTVGSHGPNTDRVLLDHPDAMALTPVDEPAAFARAAVALAGDPARRALMGAAARRLYEREFDWPVLARRLSADLRA